MPADLLEWQFLPQCDDWKCDWEDYEEFHDSPGEIRGRSKAGKLFSLTVNQSTSGLCRRLELVLVNSKENAQRSHFRPPFGVGGQRLSATRLGGMLTVTCHPLGPPKVAGPLHPTVVARRLSATRLGGMFAVTCHPLGPPKVAGPLHRVRSLSSSGVAVDFTKLSNA